MAPTARSQTIEPDAAMPPEPQATAATADPRFARRRPSKLTGHILAEGLGSALPCIVVDSSATGAQLHLTTGRGGTPATNLPERIRLQIPFERVEMDCRIAWRTEKKLGVRYISPARPLAKSPKPRQVELPPKPKSLVAKIFGTK